MSRSIAREKVFKLVFEYVFNNEENNLLLAETIEELKDEEPYIRDVYFGVIKHYDELCEFISNSAKGFSFKRLFKIDIAILLVALYEIKYIDEIPIKVSINEALNLAKSYSTEKSNKFINGILSNLVN